MHVDLAALTPFYVLVVTRIDGLLVDPEHPQAGEAESVKEWLQALHSECFAQLATHAESRQVLLANPAVSEALQDVVQNAMGGEARNHASAALGALGHRHADWCSDRSDESQKHVMLSYQWCVVGSLCVAVWHGLTCTNDGRDVQRIMQRVNDEMIKRGYLTWFDLVNMKGSTVDAMSDAIDNAAVMLYGVSLACECITYHCSAVLVQQSSTLTHCDMSRCADKESANCRLEASLQLVLDITVFDISVLHLCPR